MIHVQKLKMVQNMNVAQKPNLAHLRVVPKDRRVRSRETKRAAMLDAAGRLIDRVGLAGVTMQLLAEELDCAVGTIYLYFPSKAALLAALQGEAIDTLRASFDKASQDWTDVLADEVHAVAASLGAARRVGA